MSNPFVHVELNTTDVLKAKSFYGQLFDWILEDVPMGELDYTMIKVGKGTGGGMMKQLIPGAGSAWLPYVEVADIKASTKKAKDLGGKVMVVGSPKQRNVLPDVSPEQAWAWAAECFRDAVKRAEERSVAEKVDAERTEDPTHQ